MEEKNKNNSSDFEKKHKSKLIKFIKQYKVILSFVLIIVILFAWSIIRINSLERSHEKQTQELLSEFNSKIDSLVISNMEYTTEVFSWVIRSELVRKNKEEVNHLFNNFIKTPNVVNIQLIDNESYEILISTDKKDEGNMVDKDVYDVSRPHKKELEEGIEFINPIMGHNRLLGILVVKTQFD